MFILAPYLDLDKIAESGQCFRWKKTGHRAYQISAFGKTLNARHTAVPDEVELDCSPQDYYGTWARYFDLEADYEQYERELKTRSDTGAYLLAAARAAKGIRILKQELWALLLKWDLDSPVNFKPDGHTVHDYDRRFQLEDDHFLTPGDTKFRWNMLDGDLQKSLF